MFAYVCLYCIIIEPSISLSLCNPKINENTINIDLAIVASQWFEVVVYDNLYSQSIRNLIGPTG